MKTLYTILLLIATSLTGRTQISTDSIVIPMEGNSWSTSANTHTVFFRLRHTGTIRVTTGPSYISTYNIKDTGYVGLTLSGREVETITLTGAATRDATFVPNNEGDFFYWGRRGPSVHLNYPLPEGTNAEWFYNEVFVPSGYDIQGSYFMAGGFSQGYFGMQVNSPTERHILFSVWSPFSTDDPKKIPDSQKIELVAKGPSVHAGEFGNEGSGGQSYLNSRPGSLRLRKANGGSSPASCARRPMPGSRVCIPSWKILNPLMATRSATCCSTTNGYVRTRDNGSS